MLRKKAEQSKDKNLFEVYKMLEELRPGCTTHINSLVHIKSQNKTREFDIITKDTIYEVKSGKARHRNRQFFAQLSAAKDLGKDYVIFSPGSTNYQVKCIRAKGIKIYNNFKEFYESEANK